MSAPALERVTFTTSRMLDFFSEKELTAQTGHGPAQWPLVILKELADNALDHCEEAGVAPVIDVTVDGDGITVTDNGKGISPETLGGVLDYSVRVSSREAYCAPDRGAQGNALKTIMAMPFVLDGTAGRVTVTARGFRHEIEVRVDPIRQEPDISHAPYPADVKTGTRVTVHWPDSACSILDQARGRFFQIASGYVWLNPHLTLNITWGDRSGGAGATSPAWAKWKPNEPTSPHWYTPQSLERLIAAYVTHPSHAGMSVREFVTQFRGLSGTAKGKLVLAETGMTRMNLADLANGQFDSAAIARLLKSMQAHSRPVKPAQLGIVGREHLSGRLADLGAEMESFEYKRVTGESAGQPWVAEAAFAWCPDRGYRTLVTGVNWSPGLANQFRQAGQHGESLDTLLERQRVDEDCVLVLHLACPVVSYENRGKSAVILPPGSELTDAITGAIVAVTKKWATQRKAEERQASARVRRYDAMTRPRRVTIKEAAWHFMEQAYMKASAGGTLPANARQIMYAARPQILAATGRDELDDQYFTQTLLPDYVIEHGLADAWDVVYDARGHLLEPHTDAEVSLGTLGVRAYLGKIGAGADDRMEAGHLDLAYPTIGPAHRYSGILFIEKEGFLPLLRHTRIAERYDVAIMSTKGMSNVAARTLIDRLCGGQARLLIARDFDKAGFSIAGTLTRDTRRYAFDHAIDVVDLGIRLADAEAYGLDSEPVWHRGSIWKIDANLRENGANAQEIAFLRGRRVELNAFTSDQFIEWLEAKLGEHGSEKVVPRDEVLTVAYRRARMRHVMNSRIDEIAAAVRAGAAQAPVPEDLGRQVEERLDNDPELSWDTVIAEIAESADDADGTE